jgi:hypothetical protein
MLKYLTSKLKDGSIILLLLTSFALSGCNKDDNNCQGVECLPPATQTGAGTFGCLVNGVPYVDNSGFFNCFYQMVDGEYYFGIGSNKDLGILSQVIIASTAKEITLNLPINLNANETNEFYAEIGLIAAEGDFVTTDENDGTITFTTFILSLLYIYN